MSLVQIDPDAVRFLADQMERAAGDGDAAADRVASGLVLAGLADAVPETVRDRDERWRDLAAVLRLRADEVDAFTMYLPPSSASGLLQVTQLGDGALVPSLAQADGLILTLVELSEGLADLGAGALDGATEQLLLERSEVVLEGLAHALGVDPMSAALYAATRGIDLLSERLAELEYLSPVVAEAMGIDAVRRRRDGLAAGFAQLFPLEIADQVLAAIGRGATVAEALAPWDPHPERTRRHSEALERWTAHGGSFEEAYEAGAIDAEDLTFLVPIETRGSAFFLDPSEFAPQPYWLDTEVAHYWRFLDGEGVNASSEWVAAQVERMPGISTTIEPADDDDSWLGDLVGWLITAGTYALSALEGCVGFVDALGPSALATGGAIAGYVAVAFPGVAIGAGAVVLATCLFGGAANVVMTAATSD